LSLFKITPLDHATAESGVNWWQHDLRNQSYGNGANQAGQGSFHAELGQTGLEGVFFIF
jgi:hypothetical protein